MTKNKQQLNITCRTDVVLHDRLIFDGETFDPSLSVGIVANLVTSMGKRNPLDVEVEGDELVISIPWVEGRNPGCYGLEVTGTCNSKKWSTYADSLIRYTKATKHGAGEVTVESDYYDITMEVGYRYGEGGNVNDVLVNGESVVQAGKARITMPTKVSDLENDADYATQEDVEESKISEVEATIDDNVGTPEVEATLEGHKLTLAFQNLLGDGIASIEQTTTSEESEGVNVVTITTVGGKVGTFEVRNGELGEKGIQGEKGEQGDSVLVGEGDLPLANSLGDSSEKAITQKAVTNGIINATKYKTTEIDLSELTELAWAIYQDKWKNVTSWTGHTSRRYIMVPVSQGKYRLVNTNGISANYTVLTTDTITENASASYATGWSLMVSGTSQEFIIDVPEDGHYLYLQVHTDSDAVSWGLYTIDGSAYAATTGAGEYIAMSQKATTEAILKACKYELEDVDISGLSQIDYDIFNNKWTKVSTYDSPATHVRRAIMVPVSQGSYRLTKNSLSSRYAVLTTNTIVANSAPSYASGWNVGVTGDMTELVINVPANGHYLFLWVKSELGDIEWNVSKIIGSAFADDFGDDPYKGVSQSFFTEKVEPLALAAESEEIDYLSMGLTLYQIYPSAQGTWENAGGTPPRQGVFLPVVGGSYLKMKGNYNVSADIALLKDIYDVSVGANISFADGITSRDAVMEGETKVVKLPKNCKYIYVNINKSNEAVNSSAPYLEYLSLADYMAFEQNKQLKAMQGASIIQQAKVVSDLEYTYAFLPWTMYVVRYESITGETWKRPEPHIMVHYMGNKKETNADRTDNPNKFVLADLDMMTGEVTNTEMPDITDYVDSEGNPLAQGMKAYNACFMIPYEENGVTNIAMVGEIGTAQQGFTNFSIGYKRTFEGTTYTQCHLAYNDGISKEVEFTVNNYRQMLYDMGWTDSVINSGFMSHDFISHYYYNGLWYIVMCGYQVYGTNQAALPLVLLSSSDLATWTVVRRLGTRLLKGGEMQFVIQNNVLYLISRYQLYTSSVMNQSEANLNSGGYHLMAFNFNDGSELWFGYHRSRIKSLPLAIVANGKVWLAHNVLANIFGTPSDTSYPNGRQQLDFFECNEDGEEYSFSVESPTGLNYATAVTVPTLKGRAEDSTRTIADNLDRVYIAFSEDRRNLNYRQLGNVSVADITPLLM